MKTFYYRAMYKDVPRQYLYKRTGFIKAADKDEARKIFAEHYPEGYQLAELFNIESYMRDDKLTEL